MKRPLNLLFCILLLVVLLGWGASVFWQYGFIHITGAAWEWMLRVDSGSVWLDVSAPPTYNAPSIHAYPTHQPFRWALFYFIRWGDGGFEVDFPIWLLGLPSLAYFAFRLLVRRQLKVSSDVPAIA